jgi:hypothetical protein
MVRGPSSSGQVRYLRLPGCGRPPLIVGGCLPLAVGSWVSWLTNGLNWARSP